MGDCAARLTGRMLRRFEFEMNRAARTGSAESIHDLRVAIRRLSQGLRLFRQFFPRGAHKRIRRALKTITAQAARVRNCDVALELLDKAGLAADSPLAERLRGERDAASRALRAALTRWSRRGAWRKWREALGL